MKNFKIIWQLTEFSEPRQWDNALYSESEAKEKAAKLNAIHAVSIFWVEMIGDEAGAPQQG